MAMEHSQNIFSPFPSPQKMCEEFGKYFIHFGNFLFVSRKKHNSRRKKYHKVQKFRGKAFSVLEKPLAY